jgi:hypothetical protein
MIFIFINSFLMHQFKTPHERVKNQTNWLLDKFVKSRHKIKIYKYRNLLKPHQDAIFFCNLSLNSFL